VRLAAARLSVAEDGAAEAVHRHLDEARHPRVAKNVRLSGPRLEHGVKRKHPRLRLPRRWLQLQNNSTHSNAILELTCRYPTKLET